MVIWALVVATHQALGQYGFDFFNLGIIDATGAEGDHCIAVA